jgi:hypothetical protein
MNELDNFLKETAGIDNIPKQEEALPFHKDPRVQRYIERELEKRTSQNVPPVSRQADPAPVTNGYKDVREGLERLIGSDTPEKIGAIDAFERSLKTVEETAYNKAVRTVEERLEQERNRDRILNKNLERNIEDVAIKYGDTLAEKDYAKIKELALKIAPKDINGNVTALPDMETVYTLSKTITDPSVDRAKSLAAKESPSSINFSNPNSDKNGLSWKNVNKRIINSINNNK